MKEQGGEVHSRGIVEFMNEITMHRYHSKKMDLQRIATSSMLYEAHLSGRKIESLPHEIFSLSIPCAYAVQDLVTLQKVANNIEQISGYRVNIFNSRCQDPYFSDEPAYGTLTDRNLEGECFKYQNLINSNIETGVVFIADSDLDHGMSERELAENVLVAPGIEIPDSRFCTSIASIPLNLFIADNSAAGKLTTGKPIGISIFDVETLGHIRFTLLRNGVQIASGSSCDILGNPLDSLKWLIRKLESRNLKIEKGMVVSTGSLTSPLKLEKGHYKASYEMLGDVDINIV